MFMIAVTGREAHSFEAVATAEDAREKTVEAIKNLDDASTTIVTQFGKGLKVEPIFHSTPDAQVYTEHGAVEVAEHVLKRLDEALANHAA